MSRSHLIAALLAAGTLSAALFAQTKPAAPQTGIAGAVSKEVKGLTADDFPERQAALARLQTLVADQLKQRAQIQEILSALQGDLAKQQQALAMVSNDEEAQAQIAGLLEMERGLAGWTMQTLAEPLERRTALLNWGLTKEHAGVLARAYAQSLRIRIQGVKDLAKLDDDGASWTLGKLINDSQTAIRAQAMAVSWSRKPSADVVNALWYRSVSGPLEYTLRAGGMGFRFEGGDDSTSVKVDFPGSGDPMQFGEENEASQFYDSQLAGDVLVHLNSDLVAAKIKTLVEERAKAGKTLSLMEDPDWTLVTHRLVETYKIKEAIPILATEALSSNTEQMGGDMNGREFMWSGRTMAIGTFCTLTGRDPAEFAIFRARDMGDSRGWMWAVDMNPNQPNGQPDAATVTAFYTYWKAHHADFGVKEEPQPSPIRIRGGRGRPIQIDPMGPAVGGPAIDVMPLPRAVPFVAPNAPEPAVAPQVVPIKGTGAAE